MTNASHWIVGMCAIGVVVAMIVFFLYRLDRIASGLRRRYEARLDEQDRIARDMRDWLLQSTQGLMLNVQAVSRSNPVDSQTRVMLERALDDADRFIDRERRHLDHVQAPVDLSGGIVEAIQRIVQDLFGAVPETFQITVDGKTKALDPVAKDGACRIVEDLLVGGFTEVNTGKIVVKVVFAREGMTVRLCVDHIASGSALSTARLRACVLGARIEIWRRLGAGSEIDLHFPARVAYPRRWGDLQRWRLHSLVVATS